MAETKIFTLEEVSKNEDSKKVLIVINNNVYDVAEFLNEHPGGEEVLLEQNGKDASESFEDVGHSSDAREMMAKYKVGELAEADRKKETTSIAKGGFSVDTSSNSSSSGSSLKAWIIPVALAILATVFFRFYFIK